MPRSARRKSGSGIFHLMFSGINKQTIFEDDEDKERFLETIKRYKGICKYIVYGYCLMSNHVHLVLKENEETVSTIVKKICSSYVFWYNSKYGRSGHLFQDRYKSEPVEDDEYLATVLRYIHQNPVKAGLCKNLQDYRWSSFNEYLSDPSIVDVDFVLDTFSDDAKEAKEIFVRYSNEQNDDKCLDFDERIKLADWEVSEYFRKCGVQKISELKQMETGKRNSIIKEIKAVNGVTIRQLSRITGVSKSVIDRI